MAKQEKNKDKQIEREEEYVEFLKNRLESINYKTNVSKEEYELTRKKYEKEKFKLRVLKGE